MLHSLLHTARWLASCLQRMPSSTQPGILHTWYTGVNHAVVHANSTCEFTIFTCSTHREVAEPIWDVHGEQEEEFVYAVNKKRHKHANTGSQ